MIREPMPDTPPSSPAVVSHGAQADALASLRGTLDRTADFLERAAADRDAAKAEAESARARSVAEARQTLEATLARIAHHVAEARQQIAQRHATRAEPIRREKEAAIAAARAELDRRTSKARADREEARWLAETVYESGVPKAKRIYEEIRGQVAPVNSELDQLEESLVRALGPANTARVAEAPTEHETHAEEPTLPSLLAALEAAREAVDAVKKGGPFKVVRGRETTVRLGTSARDRITAARRLAEDVLAHAAQDRDDTIAALAAKRDRESDHAARAARTVISSAERATGQAVREAEQSAAAQLHELNQRRDRDLAEVDRWETDQTARAHAAAEEQTADAEHAAAVAVAAADAAYDRTRRDTLEALARDARAAVGTLRLVADTAAAAAPAWDDPAWLERPHPARVPGVLPVGSVSLDLARRLERLDPEARSLVADLPARAGAPLVVTLPGPASLLIDHDPGAREPALAALRALMLRVLGAFPAGKVRFTMADPVGLGQSFAGFMRLADREPSPVGLRIWSEPVQIERQLADLTEHMQTVIQKYLRADYATIEDYNHAAGEIAEPYRFVVIADLPQALTETGAQRLASILESGPRCGVYALLAGDLSVKLPPALTAETLEAHAVRLRVRAGSARVDDPRFAETAVTLAEPPADAFAARLLDRVAQAGAAAGRVEVPFARLAPDDAEIWTRSASEELSVPLGRSGAQKIQHLRLGSGTRQHALIAGRTGSGKSTLLHVMITAAALWHTPEELNLYLIDFKKGVEFKAYTGGKVPHVRAVAIESDREFGLSVLQRLDEELTRRGERFRALGAQDLAAARRLAPAEPLPRILLLIDEFQEFFVSDDEVASEASLLLDRLVRQGRAFGVHVVLGSQTLSGAYSLARSTLGQMGVRIALQCSEADSYLILGEDNNAARLLSRPGEAIYNDAGGLVEANSPFQTAWLPDADRDEQLARLPRHARPLPAPVVFEGNAPARIDTAARALAGASPDRSTPRALLGDPVAIAPPVAAALRKRSGANLLIVGPQPEPALGMLAGAAISAGCTPGARVFVIDPTPEDEALAGRLGAVVRAAIPGAEIGAHRDAVRVVGELDALARERESGPGGEPVILVLAGLHRLRDLRRSEDYSFSLDDDAGESADKRLARVLREGPNAGVWTLAWCDTLTNLERTLERATVREFGLRALLQMGASDSAALIDSSAAANLGVNRALLADDETGTLVKFRPVDLPDPDAARRAAEILRA